MSQQIQISGGAKVRDLQDVIIGTSGVLSSLAFNVANGVPKLDVNGKILVSQLPNSVMEYKGVWNAATNTPTLANGTGNQGDVYLCNVAGTTNFGAGPIAFVVGDQVIYSSVAEGSIWQRASGATGTVTSVALTESGDSLNITGSPITTSGTINIGFNGTNLQYVNGAGNLTTFPTLITSIGLSMPSAFSVANSPLTANGTIAVTGAGTTAQYIRGDGSLATFPTIATEAQRLITEVYNETGATLSKGTVVYINGGHGNLPTITKALATGDATSAQTYGIVQTDITNMNNGYVVVIGSLTDLDTSAYVEGTQLYLSSTTAGAWTSVKQYAPAHLVYVAIVTRSHPTQGVVEVMIQNGFEMDELHNVSAQSPLNNQGLFYNTSTSLWENKSIATALGYTPADDSLVVHLTGNETIAGSKTFSGIIKGDGGILLKNGVSPTTSGYTGIGAGTSGVNVSLGAGGGGSLIFQSTSYDYTFPAATGTIALTSDIPSLAGYVTLATTQTITGAKTFSGAVTFTSSLTTTSNVTFSNSGFTLVLQPPTLSVNRTVTLPDATGTLALTSDLSSYVTLATAQTISGVKTFSTYQLVDGGILIKHGANVIASGYTGIGSTTTGLIISLAGGGSGSLIFNTTSNYQYTFPNATGTIALVGGSGVGTVTSVAALTIGTTGTDVSSSVANSTTTPVITLNVPTASATNRGALSSADWTTFNNKQSALTNPVTGTGTTNYIPKFTGTSTIGNSIIQDGGNSIGIAVTPQAWLSSVYRAINIGAGGFIYSRTDTDDTQIGSNWYRDNSAVFRYVNNGYATSLGQNGGAFQWNTAPSGTAGNVVTLTAVMTLTASGRLLIGTPTEASYLLDVNGTGRFSGNVAVTAASGSVSMTLLTGSSYGYFYNDGTNIGLASNLGSTGLKLIVSRSAPDNSLVIASTGAATFSSSVTATSFFESSDSRLKTLIQNDYQTKGIGAITPKLYTKNGKVELGYYAQDFVGILDSAVSKGSDDMLSLSYREVHTAKIYALEQEIKELKAKLN